MQVSTCPPEAIDAIVGSYHGAPFDVLGPHAVDGGLAVRAFYPNAESLTVVTNNGAERFSMVKVHPEGFFEAFLPERDLPFAYQLEEQVFDGATTLHEDPYRFHPVLSEFDSHLLTEGTHLQIYDKLGAQITVQDGVPGVSFAVWAPNALRVSVIGDFNNWDGRCHPMRLHSNNGIWELFIPGLGEGTLYKYEIKTHYMNYMVAKSDPVGFAAELRPNTASVVWNIDKHDWNDMEWMTQRAERQGFDQPVSIYEVHLGSWRRKNGWEWLTYRDLAHELVPYVQELGYTHIELLPIAEHPFDGSWGYQVTGFFAPTSRFGTPDDFQYFVDVCHQAGIGVILDWVPAHFPKDEHGLGFFDGTHLYEHADPRQGAHPDWGTYIFNYGRNEVSQFLISNALFWLDKYHIDGLRVDAVASMLYLDFSREPGEWLPNRYGGRENIEAIEFLRRFNERVHELYPGALTLAEESTAWPGVTQPTSEGGLGFTYKWNMGWMHDTLQYISNDPVHRAYHHGTLTFSLLYAFSEKFVLPFSHDEVVHLKRSMLDKMPGDIWQKFANLRLLYGYQWSHPGKKLLFMGGEFGQWQEWSEARSLDWHLLDMGTNHSGTKNLVADLNALYRQEAALHENDFNWDGFSWLEIQDSARSILAYMRHAESSDETVIVVANFTPVVREAYRLGVPDEGTYAEILNSDSEKYGGSNVVNTAVPTTPTPWHDQPFSIELTLPPLGIVFLKRQ